MGALEMRHFLKGQELSRVPRDKGSWREEESKGNEEEDEGNKINDVKWFSKTVRWEFWEEVLHFIFCSLRLMN